MHEEPNTGSTPHVPILLHLQRTSHSSTFREQCKKCTHSTSAHLQEVRGSVVCGSNPAGIQSLVGDVRVVLPHMRQHRQVAELHRLRPQCGKCHWISRPGSHKHHTPQPVLHQKWERRVCERIPLGTRLLALNPTIWWSSEARRSADLKRVPKEDCIRHLTNKPWKVIAEGVYRKKQAVLEP